MRAPQACRLRICLSGLCPSTGRRQVIAEREYGNFYRAVPLPEGVKLEDVKATFADGVLEVSIPLPAKPEAKVRTVAIEHAPTVTKTAA